MHELAHPERPLYAIGVVARLVELHPQTLRRYEDLGLVRPARRSGRRHYSRRDIDRLRQIVRLTEDLGVNLAGVEVILHLKAQVRQLQDENTGIQEELRNLRSQVARLQDENARVRSQLMSRVSLEAQSRT